MTNYEEEVGLVPYIGEYVSDSGETRPESGYLAFWFRSRVFNEKYHFEEVA